jgi:hypothetical protein
MRTKIGLLSILMTVLLAFGGTAIAQDYEEPQDPTLQENELNQEPMEETATDVDVDVDVDAEADLEATTDSEFATDDEFAADDELPQTASFLPLLGALGLLSLAGGAALRGRK